MSRIQDILAKADRDGTARRLPSSATGGAPATVLTPHFDGTATLPNPFAAPMPLGTDTLATKAPAAAAPVIEVPHAVPAEPRTARATLHPALVAAIAPHSDIAEQFRAIRSKLTQREELGSLRTIGITSPASGEGKSMMAANLALTMAQELQRRVVLIEGDLRTPAVHSLFATDRGPGITEVLNGEATLDEALVHLPEFRLTLLPAGGAADYPTELLGSTSMRRLLDALSSRFDRIVLDLPPALPLADVGTLAPHLDGVLMVVRAGVTQRPALDQALGIFEEQKVLGVVLNEAHV
jgi:capsular exopolysaccharide synthesis family protein